MLNIRKDFPIFKKQEFIYLDSAATSQKPQVVIDAMSNFYSFENAPVHRGIYKLAENATIEYEMARSKVANFIKADSKEIIFTKNATEGINLICDSWARKNLKKGDIILVSELEHHSNLAPWIRLSNQLNLELKYIPINNSGLLDYEKFKGLLSNKVKLICCTAISNVLGTKIDIELIIKLSKSIGAKVLIDAAQAAAHMALDISKLNPDFLVFSGHKMLGPTGIGVLYVSSNIIEDLEPYQVGGGMVFSVGDYNITWTKAPYKFEAGTQSIAQAVGLSAAIDYINKNVNFDILQTYEASLCSFLIKKLEKITKIKLLGPIEQLSTSGHLISFIYEGIHAHDFASYLNNYNICVRAGNHCAQPLHRKLNIESSIRVSFYGYNTFEDVEKLVWYIKNIDESNILYF